MTATLHAIPRSLPWVAAAGALAVVVQALPGADARTISVSLVAAVGATSALLLARRRRSPSLVLAALLTSAGSLVLGGLWGGVLPLMLLIATTQLTASLVLPRRAAFGLILVTACSAAAGSALRSPIDGLTVGLVALALGLALVQVVASALAEVPVIAAAAVIPPPSTLAGPTRIELDRVRHELDLMASQLRREARSRASAEAQLIEAFRVKEVFLATMSHELRTPLNQIIGYSELLIEEAEESDPAALTGDVTRIHEAAMNLFDLIGNVLDQSQIESGTLEVTPEPLDLLSFIERLTQSFAAQARSRSNTLRLRCPEDIGVIVSDRDKLHTILKNLIGNACKFTEGGTIRLSVELDLSTSTPTYVFVVRDTGIGIATEDLTRLFRPFEQVDGARTRRFDGSGLGLAVSRHFAAMLGGELSAESSPGEGSTFTLRLPRECAALTGADMIVRSIAG